jgi:AcrR family transcriptional regulator
MEICVSQSKKARGGRPPRIRPEEILDVLGTRIDNSWTMASIALELGVSEAAIYYYFPTKTDLQAALGQRLFSRLDLPRVHGSWEAWLAETGLCLYDFFVQSPLMSNASIDLLGDTAGEALPTESLLADLVSLGFSLDSSDTVITTILVLASGHASMAVYLDEPRGNQFKERVKRRAASEPDTLTSRLQLSENAWDIRQRFIASLDGAIHGFGRLRG